MIRKPTWIDAYRSANPQKERDMEKPIVLKNDFGLGELKISIPQSQRIIFDKFAPNETELVLGDDFEMKEENGVFKVVRKEKKYPKTYEECCRLIGAKADRHYFYTKRDKEVDYPHEVKILSLLDDLRMLLICRDAYWKIAGEEMGLGKAWEPDWKNGKQKKYCIYNNSGYISKGVWYFTSDILVFPTEEMRDAFYENFKDLIEQCKELL